MKPKSIFFLLLALSLLLALFLLLAWGNIFKASAQNEGQINERQIEEVVNIYSYRQPELIAPLLARFTASTGIKTQVIFAKKGLVERVRIEGARSPADIILTNDIGLTRSAADVAQAVIAPLLQARIAAPLRDPNHLWFGLSQRARVAFVSRQRVAQTALSYEELADPQWRGRICMRSGQHPYNVALFAAMLAHLGEAAFTTWLRGVKANLAFAPSGNDRTQVRAIYGGSCDIAIGNTYYMGKMLTNEKNPEQKQWAQAVRLVFLTMPSKAGQELEQELEQKSGGTHVNISGMVMAKYAPHPKRARALMTFLVSDEAQALYAALNFEYPIVPHIAPSPLVASWGNFTPDFLPMRTIAAKRKDAARLVDEVGFND